MTRERSFWGWGWADKFPDEASRRGLGDMCAALLGLAPGALVPRPAPSLAGVIRSLPAPRLAAPDAHPWITTDSEERVRHTYGRSFPDLVRGFAGDFAVAPDLVARPVDEEQVVATLAWCRAERAACIPYGGGTSVVGGVEAAVGGGYRAALSLDLRGLDRVLEIDETSRAARIQAGATGPGLEAQLAARGLTLRHFPQSFEFSTLGGWIATRAGGHFATLYTHIDDLVESIRMITPAGVWASRRLPASGAGPSPDRMVLGSEGILGVITEAWVRVQPRPRRRGRATVLFDRFFDGGGAVRAIAQAGLYPANCRLLDAAEAMVHGVAAAAGKSVLLLAFESADHPVGPWIERAVALAEEAGGICSGGVKLEEPQASARASETGAAPEWKQAFLEAPYRQSVLVSLGVIADTFETACTWDRWPALHAAVQAAVEGATGGKGLLTCRFSHAYPDGPAPYFTFLVARDPPGGADEMMADWQRIKRAASDAILAAGATITHHHSVGRMHRPWYDRQRPAPFAAALAAAKSAVDPGHILNPGVLLDPPPSR